MGTGGKTGSPFTTRACSRRAAPSASGWASSSDDHGRSHVDRRRSRGTTRKGDDRMSSWRRVALAATGFVLWAGVCAFHEMPQNQNYDPRTFKGTLRVDGKFVHNVGRLQLQVTNLGETGNQDNPRRTTVPSAEWPAGSGNDYLFAAGLWIGAIDASGIPHVTTATYEREFSPDLAPANACVSLPLDQV